METTYFLGIDISKKTFQAALTTDGINMFEMEVANTSKSIGMFFKDLKNKFLFSQEKLIICLEHTGIYAFPLLDHLIKSEIKVCVEPALQIKQSQGMKRGKSDKVDARRIAQYAYKNYQELKFWRPQRRVIQKLQALLVQRERLVKIKVQLQTPINESKEYVDESIWRVILKSCNQSIKAIKADIVKVEKEIAFLIKEDSSLQNQVKWATSVTGIGKITALNMIVATGEFERISEVKKFACYAGVAPFEHTSGSSVRGRTRVSKMANMTIKRLLHLGAMSAIRHCEELKLFYQRKIMAGKNKMSVINAVRNKLIGRVFACVKQKRTYQKIYKPMLV